MKKFKKIYIEITNICNLCCEFCSPDNRKKEYMTEESFKRILDQIKDYTDYIYLHVKGEPLLHPKINEFIEYAHKQNFKINITTNGTLINNLTNKNIRQINYSMQSINDVKDIGKTIKEFKEFIKNTNIYLSLRMWTNKAKENLDLLEMLKEEFNVDKIENKKSVEKNIFISIEDEFIWPDLYGKENVEIHRSCYGLKDHIAILVDGTVVPCCLDHKGNVNLGNVFKQELKDILETKRVEKIIEGFNKGKAVEKLCKKCVF